MPTPDGSFPRAASGDTPAPDAQARVHRQQAALVQIVTHPAVTLADLPRACAVIAQCAAEALDVERASVWLLDAGRQTLHCEALWERTPARPTTGAVLAAADYPAYFAALATGRAIEAHDARTDPRTREFAEGYLQPLGITSMLDGTIRVAGTVVGVVCHEQVGPGRVWAADEVAFAGSVADQVGQVLVCRDRNEAALALQRLNASLDQQVRARTAELETAVRDLKVFSSMAAHELRGPLRAIDAFCAMALKGTSGAPPPGVADHLRQIQAQGTRLSEILNDLERLSRAGRSPLQRERVDLGRLAAEVAADLRRHDPERVVDVVIHPGLEVRADAGLCRLALENLLGNAWKFTRGQPAARIEVGRTASGDGTPSWFVRDNGAGFDMRFADRLFAPFARLHAAAEFEGTGLGLAIVQRIVDRHGGRVWAEGTPGTGATLWWTLEAAAAGTPTAQVQA